MNHEEEDALSVLFLAQQAIDDPAVTDPPIVSPKVHEHARVGIAGLLQGIGQDGEGGGIEVTLWREPLRIGSPGNPLDKRRPLQRIDSRVPSLNQHDGGLGTGETTFLDAGGTPECIRVRRQRPRRTWLAQLPGVRQPSPFSQTERTARADTGSAVLIGERTDADDVVASVQGPAQIEVRDRSRFLVAGGPWSAFVASLPSLATGPR